MSKEVTKKRMRGILAIILSALMIAGMFSCFSVLADDVSTEESTSGSVEDNTEEPSCVVLRADDLIGKLYAPSATSAELGERDGVSVVDLAVASETDDAFIYVDLKGYTATKYIAILAYADISVFTNFSIYYHTSARGDETMGLDEDARMASPYTFGSGWQFLEYDLSNEPGWGGSIYTFRLDYIEGDLFPAGTQCEIAAVILSDDAKAVHEAAYELMTDIYTPVQTLSDFKESDAAYFNSDRYHSPTVNTRINVSEGSLVYNYTASEAQSVPQAMFDYLGYVEANGMQALTTDDFRYTVIRYRTPMISDSTMEMFTLTGTAESLFDMILKEGTYACHSAHTRYSRANAWSAMVLDMAEDDGLEGNTGLKYGWYREDGDRTFKGVRIDWCSNGFAGDYLEISDFMFYQDAVAANGMAFALSSLTVGENVSWGEAPEDPDDPDESGNPDDPNESDETLGGDILPPSWETEETTAEESAEETSQEETVLEESEEESESAVTINPGGIGGSDDGSKEKGSEVPFYIACGLLAALSVASVATVIVIRTKEKRQIKTK